MHNKQSQLATQHFLCKKLQGNVARSTWSLVKKIPTFCHRKGVGSTKESTGCGKWNV